MLRRLTVLRLRFWAEEVAVVVRGASPPPKDGTSQRRQSPVRLVGGLDWGHGLQWVWGL
jgi:hypothetical protein